MSMTDRPPASPVEDWLDALPFRRMTGEGLDQGGTTGDLAWDWDEWDDVVRKDDVRAALQAQDHTITKGGLREAALRVIEVVDEPTPMDDGTPEVEAGWYLAWEGRHRDAVDALRAALEPTHD